MNRLDNEKYYTLLAAAYSVCMDLMEDDSRVEQYLHYAYDGYREFHFDRSHAVKAIMLEMNTTTKILNMPPDMVDWVKLGILCGNNLKLLTQDNKIPKLLDENAQCPNINDVPSTGTLPFFAYDGVGSSVSSYPHYYGSMVTYNFTGYFDTDWTKRVIRLKNTVDTVNNLFYLEYITDGINYSGATVIHPYAFQVIKRWIHWKRKEFDDRYSIGDAEAAKREYFRVLHQYDLRMLTITVADLKEITRSGNKLVVKS